MRASEARLTKKIQGDIEERISSIKDKTEELDTSGKKKMLNIKKSLMN